MTWSWEGVLLGALIGFSPLIIVFGVLWTGYAVIWAWFTALDAWDWLAEKMKKILKST